MSVPSVFISYRRQDEPAEARSIRDWLRGALGSESVFMDVGSTEPGQDLHQALTSAGEEASRLLVVIGPRWDPDRVSSDDDHVRSEVRLAFVRGIPVIPLLVGGAAMPTESDLPSDIRSLASRRAIRVSHENSDVDMSRVLSALGPERDTGTSRLLIAGAALVAVAVALGVIFALQRGDAPPTTSAEDTTTTTSPVSSQETSPVSQQQLSVDRVEASSELRWFEAENLIDANHDTYWNDESARGEDAWLQFSFAEPVQINQIIFRNLKDDDTYQRSYAIRELAITINGQTLSEELEDTNEDQVLDIPNLGKTTLVRMEVLSTYPAEPVGDAPPFNELMLEGVVFRGSADSSA